MGLQSVGFVQATSLGSAVTLATIFGSAIPSKCGFVEVQAEGQPLRYRDDGTAPTATIGIIIAVGDTVIVRRGQFAKFQVIQTTAGGIANCDFMHTG